MLSRGTASVDQGPERHSQPRSTLFGDASFSRRPVLYMTIAPVTPRHLGGGGYPCATITTAADPEAGTGPAALHAGSPDQPPEQVVICTR